MRILIHISSVICCPLQSLHTYDPTADSSYGAFDILSSPTSAYVPSHWSSDPWAFSSRTIDMTLVCIEEDPRKAGFLKADLQFGKI